MKYEIHLQVDGGSNSHVVNDIRYFIQYRPAATHIQQISGDSTSSLGYGIVIIRLPNDPMLMTLWKVYYMPVNPQNTISGTALKKYNSYRSV